jgi:cytochrome d ubiquinol oxidase subunit II
MSLGELWFIVDALFWVGFFMLEGFDFGVGMLHSWVGRTDGERRVAVNAIGPFWDGNEVWLIVAGAVMFAAFPLWYASMFSAFYLALVVLLLALMIRGVSFEYGHKLDHPRWRATWRWSLTLGSLLIPLLVGVALGDLLHGLPLNAQHVYTGSFFGLLTPYGLWTGLTFVALSLLSGGTFLVLKTEGEIHDRAQHLTVGLGLVAAVMEFGFLTWTHVGLGVGFLPSPLEVAAMLAVLAAVWLTSAKAEGWAFAAAVTAAGATVGSIFVQLYPTLMVSTTAKANDITVHNAASGSYALKVMTVVAVICLPVVLVYQAWNYRVFRRRLRAPRVSLAEGGAEVPTPAGPTEAGAPATTGGAAEAPPSGL